MIALFGSALGFFSSTIPSLLGIFEKRQAHRQQLALLEAQSKHKINIANAQADIAEAENIYKHDQTLATNSAGWVTTFSATCRPVITYLFLFSYLAAKTLAIFQAYQSGIELHENLDLIYSDFDEGMVSCIIAFWFGQRAMMRKK
jgi:hypothetical protein|tara:strand:- start:424 stop:858 length:435 start_codon:yes stop_codon:yes gene_type:complete